MIGFVVLLALIAVVLLAVFIIGASIWAFLLGVAGIVGGVTICNYGYENLGALVVLVGLVVQFLRQI